MPLLHANQHAGGGLPSCGELGQQLLLHGHDAAAVTLSGGAEGLHEGAGGEAAGRSHSATCVSSLMCMLKSWQVQGKELPGAGMPGTAYLQSIY